MGIGLTACSSIAKEDKEEKEEGEQEIKFADAPAAVQKTLTKEAGGAKIETVDKEMKNGKTIYETDVTIDGKEYEICVAPDGTLISKKLEDADEEHEDKDGKGEKEDDDKEEHEKK
jgi:hypothetical protein